MLVPLRFFLRGRRRRIRIHVDCERILARLALARGSAQLLNWVVVFIGFESRESVAADHFDKTVPLAFPERLGCLNIILIRFILHFGVRHELKAGALPFRSGRIVETPARPIDLNPKIASIFFRDSHRIIFDVTNIAHRLLDASTFSILRFRFFEWSRLKPVAGHAVIVFFVRRIKLFFCANADKTVLLLAQIILLHGRSVHPFIAADSRRPSLR
jgi:hypothetical protein